MTDKLNLKGEGHAAIAQAFVDARREGLSFDTYPGALPEDLEQAYSIQELALAADGRDVIGWKVGRIPDAQVPVFGANRLAGPIFANSIAVLGDGIPEMPIYEGGFGAAEAEFLLKVSKAAPEGVGEITPEMARDLIEHVHVGFEIASSPFRGINELGPAVTVSDFGNNNGLAIGPAISDWRDNAFENWTVEVLIDGISAGVGQARNMPNGVFGAAAYLFTILQRRGRPLQPGQWISSGAVSGVHKVAPGARVEARFGAAFAINCRIGSAKPG